MAEQQHHHQHRRDRVHHVRKLHVAARVLHARHQLVEHEPRADDDHAEHDHAGPENDLLAGVEAVRRHLVAAQQAAALAQPDPVATARQLVAQEGHDDDQQRHREHRPGEVVRRLQRVGEPAEQRAADHRQQEELAERHHDAGDREDHERDRVGPVRGALERREALDASAVGMMPAERPLAPVEQRDREQHDQQQRAAVRDDPVVAHLAPGFAGGGELRAGVLHELLDQRAHLEAGQAGVALAVARLAHPAPERRVVARLRLRALRIRFVGLRLGRRDEAGRRRGCGGSAPAFVRSRQRPTAARRRCRAPPAEE